MTGGRVEKGEKGRDDQKPVHLDINIIIRIRTGAGGLRKEGEGGGKSETLISSFNYTSIWIRRREEGGEGGGVGRANSDSFSQRGTSGKGGKKKVRATAVFIMSSTQTAKAGGKKVSSSS